VLEDTCRHTKQLGWVGKRNCFASFLLAIAKCCFHVVVKKRVYYINVVERQREQAAATRVWQFTRMKILLPLESAPLDDGA